MTRGAEVAVAENRAARSRTSPALQHTGLGFCPRFSQMENDHLHPFVRVEKVADYLETLIDPFDLDVFTPHLQSNLNRLVQRTSVSPGRTRPLCTEGQGLRSQHRPAQRLTGVGAGR